MGPIFTRFLTKSDHTIRSTGRALRCAPRTPVNSGVRRQVNLSLISSVFVAALAVGIGLAYLMPIYSLPFSGCTGVCKAHIAEFFRGALLFGPVAVLVRSKLGLGVLVAIAVVLAFLGGLPGMKYGFHFDAVTESGASVNNFLGQLPSLAASVLVLVVGFSINKWRGNNAV